MSAVEEVAPGTPAPNAPTFHSLRVKAVIEETSDAVSVVFEVPSDLAEAFRYLAGQFVTLRLLINGGEESRSYSMSSTPRIDPDLQVTVKRVKEGVVSNWLVDNLSVGDRIDVSTPSGLFVLPEGDLSTDVIAFAAGSGITPIFSIIKSVLSETNRRVRMVYASRDRSSIIFRQSLQSLGSRYADRLQITYSLDEDDGFVQPRTVADVLGTGLQSEFYICGPKGFMDMVTTTLVWCGARSDQLHIELFSPDDDDGAAGGTDAQVTLTLGGRTATIAHRAEWTLVQSARAAGLKAPSSCHLGQCGTCLARVVEGRAEMTNNQVLSADEVAEGWVLTCQARPVTPELSLVYE